MKHPSKFTDVLLREIARHVEPHWLVLDPFAGSGRIHQIEAKTIGIEIEPEWAAMHPRTRVGDALALPRRWTERFDAVITSPCYGNRMADHHDARDASRRVTYRHVLGRELHPNNSGQLQYGDEYREFHMKAWGQVWRVTKPGGRFILNTSNHIRKGEIQRVTEWHQMFCLALGFDIREVVRVVTPRMRRGENHSARVAYETVTIFDKP